METNKTANSKYYDDLSQFYDKKHNINLLDMDVFKKDIQDICGHEIKGKLILDCGCGTGRGAIKFALLGNDVTAIDISTKIAEKCSKNAQELGLNVKTLACDCTKLPFEDETFDVVTTSAALHHMEDLHGTLNEIKRVLKSEGRVLFIAEPKRSVIRPKWMMDIKDRLSNQYDEKVTGKKVVELNPDVHIFDFKNFNKLIAEAGFTQINYKCFYTLSSVYRDLLYYRIYNEKVRNRILKAMNFIDFNILKILPDSCKTLFHLTAIKR